MCDVNVAIVGVHVKNSIVFTEDQTLDLKLHFHHFLVCFLGLLAFLAPSSSVAAETVGAAWWFVIELTGDTEVKCLPCQT